VASDESSSASVAGRYAAALFDLANEQRVLATVEKDLKAFQALLGESPDLRRLVESPVISAEAQRRALTAVLDQAGANTLTANFLRLLAKNRRLFVVSGIIRNFLALCARQRGEVAADVTTAHALTQEQFQALSDQLRIAVGKDVVISTKVDPGILGGLIVKVGSRMIDSSIRTKLNNLKVAMKGVR
jgi:F-type H+-transporting ATPase subunit delta